jgi:hypothetical protein
LAFQASRTVEINVCVLGSESMVFILAAWTYYDSLCLIANADFNCFALLLKFGTGFSIGNTQGYIVYPSAISRLNMKPKKKRYRIQLPQ